MKSLFKYILALAFLSGISVASASTPASQTTFTIHFIPTAVGSTIRLKDLLGNFSSETYPENPISSSSNDNTMVVKFNTGQTTDISFDMLLQNSDQTKWLAQHYTIKFTYSASGHYYATISAISSNPDQTTCNFEQVTGTNVPNDTQLGAKLICSAPTLATSRASA